LRTYIFCYRYESTITAQFFGHTHFDEFELFYDRNDLSRVTNVAYVGPSVTPYYDLNPGYRIYYIDGDHKSTTRVSVSENEGIPYELHGYFILSEFHCPHSDFFK